jgi:hypothetical protein
VLRRELLCWQLQLSFSTVMKQVHAAAQGGGSCKVLEEPLRALLGRERVVKAQASQAVQDTWELLLWPTGAVPELRHPWLLTNQVGSAVTAHACRSWLPLSSLPLLLLTGCCLLPAGGPGAAAHPDAAPQRGGPAVPAAAIQEPGQLAGHLGGSHAAAGPGQPH